MVREGEYRLRSGSLRDDDLRGMEKVQCFGNWRADSTSTVITNQQ